MGHLSPDYIHVVIESLKLAMADRDEYYGDPRFVKVPLVQLLSDEYTSLRRPLIDMRHASLQRRPGDPHGPRPIKGDATTERFHGSDSRAGHDDMRRCGSLGQCSGCDTQLQLGRGRPALRRVIVSEV